MHCPQVSIHEGVFVAAVYNPPFQIFGRRNEVPPA